MRSCAQTIVLPVAILAIGSILASGRAAASGHFTVATDRGSYYPGEPIIVSLIYCTDSVGVEEQRVPPLRPSAGHTSLELIDLSTGLHVRSTAPRDVRVGRPPPEMVAPGECGIGLIDLNGEFGRRGGDEAPMAVSLGCPSIPSGRYLLRAHLTGWTDGPASCEFAIGADSLLSLEHETVAGSRYWFFAYSQTGGLADSIPLERAMDAVGHGEGADARRARVLTRIGRLAPEERRAVAVRYDVPTEGRLVRLVARQILRQSQ